jgi:hypothetical protein
MELSERLEQIIIELRPAFSREATFKWFVILLWGIVLSTQAPAITSYLNAVGLGEEYYAQALHWFHSSSFSIDQLCKCWGRWLSGHPNVRHLNGQQVYIGDGIKVSKEGRKMPGVKRLHQESDDVSKPEWIRGHYFSALGLLLGTGEALFASPMIFKLHDGIEAVEAEAQLTLVEKMAWLCVEYMTKGSYAVLDAYYASAKVLKPFREHGLHLITRVKISTVAHAAFSRRPGKHGPGRPRQWGSEIKLRELFAPLAQCEKACVQLYGLPVTVYFQCFKFYWDSPKEQVLFVLTQLPSGKQIILLSSDLELTAAQVIEAYGWRFKIEVGFRTLVHLLGGFCYRFWLKSMHTSVKWPKNLTLADYGQDFQRQVSHKVEAFERFLNLNAIVLGLLQVLALEMPHQVWALFPRWFRTLPKHGFPSEQIVRLSLQHQLQLYLAKTRPSLLLDKLITDKMRATKHPDGPPLVA